MSRFLLSISAKSIKLIKMNLSTFSRKEGPKVSHAILQNKWPKAGFVSVTHQHLLWTGCIILQSPVVNPYRSM